VNYPRIYLKFVRLWPARAFVALHNTTYRRQGAFSNKGVELIFNPQVSFLYYPTSNINNTVYLGFNYFVNRDKNARNFYQLQLGWKTGLKMNKN